MFGFKRREEPAQGPRVSTKFCTEKFNGKYPHVGLYDCRERKVWVCKPLNGQAIRTSHARLITGADNATSTIWKDRFLCYWFYTPNTGEGYIHGYPIEWTEAHVLVRIDPNWDYDRQRYIPPELSDQVNENLDRQFKHGGGGLYPDHLDTPRAREFWLGKTSGRLQLEGSTTFEEAAQRKDCSVCGKRPVFHE